MKTIKRLVNNYKRHHSISKLLQKIFCTLLGIEKQQENINALFYFFNTLNDVSKFPPTSDPDLRILQLCDTELLGIFSELCHKHNLRYWLYGGTLLGAVRHKGFIPWDNDTDISMPRKDFEIMMDVLPEELQKYGIEMRIEYENCPMKRVGIGYRHNETGIWIDVFPVDCFNSNKRALDIPRSEMIKIEKKVRNYFEKVKNKKDAKLKVELYKKELLNIYNGDKYCIYYDNMEFKHHCPRHYDENEIFPLKTLTFEGIELDVPADVDSFLKKMYGNYMSFPKTGIEQHGNIEFGNIKDWAKKHNVDMQIVYKTLQDIRKELISK